MQLREKKVNLVETERKMRLGRKKTEDGGKSELNSFQISKVSSLFPIVMVNVISHILQRVDTHYINPQCVFFCVARLEYFSNECFISDSDHRTHRHTHTLT